MVPMPWTENDKMYLLLLFHPSYSLFFSFLFTEASEPPEVIRDSGKDKDKEKEKDKSSSSSHKSKKKKKKNKHKHKHKHKHDKGDKEHKDKESMKEKSLDESSQNITSCTSPLAGDNPDGHSSSDLEI